MRSQPHTAPSEGPSPARTAAVREGQGQHRISGAGQWRASPTAAVLERVEHPAPPPSRRGGRQPYPSNLRRTLIASPTYHPVLASCRFLGASSLRRSPRSPPPRRRSPSPSLLRSPVGGRRGGGGSDSRRAHRDGDEAGDHHAHLRERPWRGQSRRACPCQACASRATAVVTST